MFLPAPAAAAALYCLCSFLVIIYLLIISTIYRRWCRLAASLVCLHRLCLSNSSAYVTVKAAAADAVLLPTKIPTQSALNVGKRKRKKEATTLDTQWEQCLVMNLLSQHEANSHLINESEPLAVTRTSAFFRMCVCVHFQIEFSFSLFKDDL